MPVISSTSPAKLDKVNFSAYTNTENMVLNNMSRPSFSGYANDIFLRRQNQQPK